jgi:sugar (pentulose or hexulose) kinase
MEGTAYLLKRNMNTLEPSGFQASKIVMVGGPTVSDIWPEIVCDILGCPLSIVNGVNAGAIGAAILAGCGIGLFPDEREAFRLLGFAEKLLYPNKEIAQEYEFLYRGFCLQGEKM